MFQTQAAIGDGGMQATDTTLHEDMLRELGSLLQAAEHRNLPDWEPDRLVAGVLRELSAVLSKVLPTCLPHSGHAAMKVRLRLCSSPMQLAKSIKQ